MFKIEELKLISIDRKEYSYKFSTGINYFQGENDTGKTVFYNFIDYMFGSSAEIGEEEWFSNLDFAELKFVYRKRKFTLKRTMHKNQNYIKYSEKNWGKAISLNEYIEKLNSIFTKDVDELKKFRSFTQEDLTYRTFTLFNFLGEKSLGNIQDFFDKCNNLKYAIKLPLILDFLFNEHVAKIFNLEFEIEKLKSELKKLENINYVYAFNKKKINDSLKKLNSNILYTGKNVNKIKEFLNDLSNLKEIKNSKKEKTISELESIYHSFNEQIKVHEHRTKDVKQFQVENENRLVLLNELNRLVKNQEEYSYLINPIKEILENVENNISFNKYYINDTTIKKLKEERKKVELEIKENNEKVSIYNIEEKAFLIKLIEKYLLEDVVDKSQEIEKVKEKIKNLREDVKVLKNEDNINKIKELSDFITKLYLSSSEISGITSKDENMNLCINYYKKGNILQPTIIYEKDGNIENENYYVGSNARHTLIQLCGYLGFLRLLIIEKKFPLIPFLVLDHISMPFDNKNINALGSIFKCFYQNSPESSIQIIIFEDKSPSDLSIEPSMYHNLEKDNKSGFNPFFCNSRVRN